MATVFVTGGTGYLGRPLIETLLARGHRVRALARPGSEARLPRGCTSLLGDALKGETYQDQIAPAETSVHLVGVHHPSPSKADQFRSVDLISARTALQAAAHAGVRHFVYVSVAHPAPAMKAYIAARMEAEAAIRASGIPATLLRPWYVLGPGHWWPVVLLPAYGLMGLFPATRDTARRLGLVTRSAMIRSLAHAVENPPAALRVIEVPEIRSLSGE